MKILITGGCGFIGTNLVKYLLNMPDVEHIWVMDKLTQNSNNHVPFLSTIHPEKITFICDDILNMNDYAITDFDGIDFCLNLASRMKVDETKKIGVPCFDTNVMGAYEVANWCCKHFIRMFHFSTYRVYGEQHTNLASNIRFVEDFDLPKPTDNYATYKLFSEHMVYMAQSENRCIGACVTLRLCENFGPWESGGFVSNCIESLLTGEKITIQESGSKTKEWMYVTDTCDIVYNLLKKYQYFHHDVKTLPSCINIGSGNDFTNYDLAKMICERMEQNPCERITVEKDENENSVDGRYSVDNSLMMSLLDYKLILSWLPASIDATIHSYQNNTQDNYVTNNR